MATRQQDVTTTKKSGSEFSHRLYNRLPLHDGHALTAASITRVGQRVKHCPLLLPGHESETEGDEFCECVHLISQADSSRAGRTEVHEYHLLANKSLGDDRVGVRLPLL